MKIVDEQLLQSFREKTVCEWCRKRFPGGLDPHHIFSKGAGRVDVRINLISLDRECHNNVHLGHILRIDLLAIVAAREGLLQDDIEREIYRLRRLPKGSDISDSICMKSKESA